MPASFSTGLEVEAGLDTQVALKSLEETRKLCKLLAPVCFQLGMKPGKSKGAREDQKLHLIPKWCTNGFDNMCCKLCSS